MRTPLIAIAMATFVHVGVAQQPITTLGDTLRLSRADAVARALAANPTIEIAGALAAQARARRTQASAIPDPVGSADWEQGRGLFGAGGPTTRSLSATLTIPFPDKLRLQRRIGTGDVRSAEADSVLGRQITAALTSQAYDALIAALRRQDDLREIGGLADEFVARTRGRLEAGTAARLDVLKAEVDAGQATNDLITAERDIVNARTSLNRLLDRALDAPIVPSDSLYVPGELPGLESLLAVATVRRPELASLASQQDGAKAASRLAKEFWLPDITFGVGRDRADPGPGVLTTGISMPIPIFYWQHARGEIAESRSRERELDATARDLRAAIGEEVRSLYAATDAAIRQARFLDQQLLPAAREAHRIATDSYALGGSSALEVLDARRSLLDAERQAVDALLDANATRAELERAVATPLSTLGSGVQP
ncbi:MAG: TolC family protein [Gemmatimonadota bacterium]